MRTTVLGAFMALGLIPGAHAGGPATPDGGAEAPEAEMLRDLDMFEDPDYARDSEVAQHMRFLEQLRILEVLRFLEGPPAPAAGRQTR